MIRQSDKQKLASLLTGGRRPMQPPDRYPASQPQNPWATIPSNTGPAPRWREWGRNPTPPVVIIGLPHAWNVRATESTDHRSLERINT
jgi:hypothetical protein